MTYDWFDKNGYADEVDEPVWVMWLCETKELYLRPNQCYQFKVDPNCDKCKELDVYGHVPED